MSKREQILQALFERLKTLDLPVKRNETLPQVISETGIVMLRDGKQGEPEVILSPPICIFKHETEVEVIVQLNRKTATRNSMRFWNKSACCYRLM